MGKQRKIELNAIDREGIASKRYDSISTRREETRGQAKRKGYKRKRGLVPYNPDNWTYSYENQELREIVKDFISPHEMAEKAQEIFEDTVDQIEISLKPKLPKSKDDYDSIDDLINLFK